MAQTNMSQTANLSPEQIYNLLIGAIEPELTTDMLPHLDDLYIDETPEEREARGEWYAIAFEIFEDQYRSFIDGWKNTYINLRKKADALARTTKEKNESDDTGSIEASIQNS